LAERILGTLRCSFISARPFFIYVGADNGRGRPATFAGKQRIRLNALKYGILAQIILRDTKCQLPAERLGVLLQQLRTAIRPKNALSEIPVEQLAVTLLRLPRLYVVDSEIAPIFSDRVKEYTDDMSALLAATAVEKAEDLAFFHRGRSLELLIRFEAGRDRKVDRLFDQIQQAQRMKF
jgi:hypothetical protein